MMSCRAAVAAGWMGLMAVAANAETATLPPPPPVGLSQVHGFQDWVIACDNVRRCEAQGYHAEGGEDPPVMLRLRREAGPATPVRLSMVWGDVAEDPRQGPPQPRAGAPLTLKAGAWSFTLTVPAKHKEGDDVPIPDGQVPPLLAALRSQADALLVTQGSQRWRISLKGASAALLKMDDLQGRVGTVGALARPGSQPEDRVPAASALPLVEAVRVPATLPSNVGGLRASLLKAVLALPAVGERCDRMDKDNFDTAELLRSMEVWPLSDSQVLVSMPCWMAAYNAGSAAWVAQVKPPHAVKAVRFAGLPVSGPSKTPRQWNWDNDAPGLELKRQDDGVLMASSSAKGRGIGDCFSAARWAWNGQAFALVESTESACKLFSAGGEPLRLWRAQVR